MAEAERRLDRADFDSGFLRLPPVYHPSLLPTSCLPLLFDPSSSPAPTKVPPRPCPSEPHERNLTKTAFHLSSGIGASAIKALSTKPNLLLFLSSRKIEAAEKAIASLTEVEASTKIVPLQLDITDEQSVKEAVETVKKVLKDHGAEQLDVLVNK